tara:strand:- start:576 stop:1064 length:489 start_codon:yes stop_codon:yes gene_type:complete
MENISNEIFYVNLGEHYSNFSVGYLQMKPSFAEEIESQIIAIKNLEEYKILFLYKNSTSLKDERNERLHRLRNFEWQLTYLCVFIDIIHYLHPKIHLESKNDLVKFYANCYNSGIWDDNNLNVKLKGMKSFPYGDLGGKINTHSYTDFSLLFFNTLYDQLKN